MRFKKYNNITLIVFEVKSCGANKVQLLIAYACDGSHTNNIAQYTRGTYASKSIN